MTKTSILYCFLVLSITTITRGKVIEVNLHGETFQLNDTLRIQYDQYEFVQTPYQINKENPQVFVGPNQSFRRPNYIAINYTTPPTNSRAPYLQTLLWPPLTHQPMHSQDGYIFYDKFTLSSTLPSESHRIDCIFDHILLLLDLQTHGYDLNARQGLIPPFNISPEANVCYLPFYLNYARKTLHGYRLDRYRTTKWEQVEREEHVWQIDINDLLHLIDQLCNTNVDMDVIIDYTHCQDPQLHLLYRWLLETPQNSYPSFLEIASLFSLLPSLSEAKRNMWREYLVYRGVESASTVKYPLAFHGKTTHPLLPYFTAHLSLSSKEEEMISMAQPLRKNDELSEAKDKGNEQSGMLAGKRLQIQEKHRVGYENYFADGLKRNVPQRRTHHLRCKLGKISQNFNTFSHPIVKMKNPFASKNCDVIATRDPVEQTSYPSFPAYAKPFIFSKPSANYVKRPDSSLSKNFDIIFSRIFSPIKGTEFKASAEQGDTTSIFSLPSLTADHAVLVAPIKEQKENKDEFPSQVELFFIPRNMLRYYKTKKVLQKSDDEILKELLANVQYIAERLEKLKPSEENDIHYLNILQGFLGTRKPRKKYLTGIELRNASLQAIPESLLTAELYEAAKISFRLINAQKVPDLSVKRMHPLVIRNTFIYLLAAIDGRYCKTTNDIRDAIYCFALLSGTEDAYMELLSYYFQESLSDFDIGSYRPFNYMARKDRNLFYKQPERMEKNLSILNTTKHMIRHGGKSKKKTPTLTMDSNAPTLLESNPPFAVPLTKQELQRRKLEDSTRERALFSPIDEEVEAFIENSRSFVDDVLFLIRRANMRETEIYDGAWKWTAPLSTANRSHWRVPLSEREDTKLSHQIAAVIRKSYKNTELLKLWTFLIKNKAFSQIYEDSPYFKVPNDYESTLSVTAAEQKSKLTLKKYFPNQLVTIGYFLKQNGLFCRRYEILTGTKNSVVLDISNGPVQAMQEPYLGMLASLKTDLPSPILQNTPYSAAWMEQALGQLKDTPSYERINEDMKALCDYSSMLGKLGNYVDSLINHKTRERRSSNGRMKKIFSVFELLFSSIVLRSVPDETSLHVNDANIRVSKREYRPSISNV